MRGLEAQASDGGATTPDPKAPRSAGTLRSLAAKLGMWLVAWVAFVAALAMRQSWASAAHAQSVETFTSSERALGAILKKPATGHDLSFLVSSRDASLITKAESLEGKTLAVETREMSINFFPRTG